MIARLRQIGAKVRRVTVPQDKPKKWDAADAVAEGLDVSALLRSSAPVADGLQPLEAIQISRWRALDRFTGHPQARRWLVEGVFPQAQAALVAAAGGVGKSFLLLALAREVAAFDGTKDQAPIVFGSALAGHGVAIYITAEHIAAIRTALANQVPEPFVLHGRMSKKQRAALIATLDALSPDAPRVLLATGKLVGEGFDHPPLDTLVLAMPVSWKGTLQQYAGRLHREHASKTDVRIIDFVDTGHPALLRMWDKRQRGYRAMGYRVDSGVPSVGRFEW